MRRTSAVAVPLASALVGAVAAASVAWAAQHAAPATPQASTVTTVTHTSRPHYVLVRGDDDGPRWVPAPGAATAGSQSGIPVTHTVSGASGAVR